MEGHIPTSFIVGSTMRATPFPAELGATLSTEVLHVIALEIAHQCEIGIGCQQHITNVI